MPRESQEKINATQKIAVQKYNQRQYKAALQLFQLIRDHFNEMGVNPTSEDYVLNEKSINFCARQIVK